MLAAARLHSRRNFVFSGLTSRSRPALSATNPHAQNLFFNMLDNETLLSARPFSKNSPA